MELDMNSSHFTQSCPKVDCRKKACECGFEYVALPAVLGDDSEGSEIAPRNGAYCNTIIEYEATGHLYFYNAEGIPIFLKAGISSFDELSGRPKYNGEEMTSDTDIPDLTDEISGLSSSITGEAVARLTADTNLQTQIDAISVSSDVKDVVGTKAELINYDTSTLSPNDIIKVLQDETEGDATTYYRWTGSAFILIGEEGPYYTRSQVDAMLGNKQNTLTAGNNIQISNNTISATDTTYTAGNGLVLANGEFSVSNAVAMKTDIPTDNSQLTNGAGFQTASDVASAVASAVSDKQDVLTAGANIQINGTTISATDTTYSNMSGASASSDGTAGLVPAPLAGDEGKFLAGNGTWTTISPGGIPVASATVLGGIRVGTNLMIDPDTGVLSASGGGQSTAVSATDWEALWA